MRTIIGLIITILILGISIFLVTNNVKKKIKGKCEDCSNCNKCNFKNSSDQNQ